MGWERKRQVYLDEMMCAAVHAESKRVRDKKRVRIGYLICLPSFRLGIELCHAMHIVLYPVTERDRERQGE